MIRNILIHPDPRLKKVCAPVTEITDDLRRLADDMLQTMYDAPGIGLAAPQVGVIKRLLVMDCVKDPEAAPRPMILFNPEVIWASEDQTTYEEGCLSIPEQYAEVERPATVTVRWHDRDGAEQRRDFLGPLGDLRAARDRPPERQAVHRLPRAAEAADDHPQDGKAEARTRPQRRVMAARPCVPWPAQILRSPAGDVAAITDEIRAIWADMIDTMEAMPGYGLAAVQIGVPLRLAVVDCSQTRDQAVRMANPEVLHASVQLREHEEASPNLPGVSAMVERPRAVTVRFLNADGAVEERDFVGLWATSVQHQIDHLAGKMYFDRLSALKRQRLIARAEKVRRRA